MRLLERTLKRVYIAAAAPVADELGGMARGFSEDRVAARATLVPIAGDWQSGEAGLEDARRCLLLLPLDAPIAPGDGVAEAADGPVVWLCRDARRWSAHIAADMERVIAP